ncbi:hypothetical protein GIB67_028227 [Kingdonia uniflora]|uniref:Amino acid transporter transmembrane domain-containing protein n=1 Tax=Kingdonia uniflora TaxID=39325 RepID=A0A7J7KZ62_9MAGN|nr:hypothetical protein GIB67_028227 [Kingdonia uniflora]
MVVQQSLELSKDSYDDDGHYIRTGRNQTWMCGFLQYLIMFRTGIAYVITTSICMRAIQRSNCFYKEGHAAPCAYGDAFYMLLFGADQIFISQIPHFHNMPTSHYCEGTIQVVIRFVVHRQDINPHLIPWFKVVSQTLRFVYDVVGNDTTDDFEDVGHSTSIRAMMDEYYVEQIDSSAKQKSTPSKQAATI